MLRSKSFKWHLWFLTIGLLVLSFHQTLAQQNLSRLKNHVAISTQLHTCGQIDERALSGIRADGVETIISLSTESPSEIILHKALASKLGMKFVHIPVSWKKPTLQSLNQFFYTMNAHKNAKVLVHCRLNWRASAYVYLYRRIRLGEEEEVAKAAMLKVWNPERNKTWQGFMQSALEHFQSK